MTPAFVFTGTQDAAGNTYGLYRVYVFSDKQCVNTVFRGAIVGSPAYAARNKGTLKLPTDDEGRRRCREARSSSVGDEPARRTRPRGIAARARERGRQRRLPPARRGSSSSSGTSGSPRDSAPGDAGRSRRRTATGRRSSCSRAAGRTDASTGRSCPVKQVPKVGERRQDRARSATPTPSCRRTPAQPGACSPSARPRRPVVAGQGTPYASGLSPTGRLIASAGSKPFYGHPARRLAARARRGHVRGRVVAHALPVARRQARRRSTAAPRRRLPLKPGTWWYRIRGINSALPAGHQTMTWSQPLQLKVAKPKFRLVASR